MAPGMKLFMISRHLIVSKIHVVPGHQFLVCLFICWSEDWDMVLAGLFSSSHFVFSLVSGSLAF